MEGEIISWLSVDSRIAELGYTSQVLYLGYLAGASVGLLPGI